MFNTEFKRCISDFLGIVVAYIFIKNIQDIFNFSKPLFFILFVIILTFLGVSLFYCTKDIIKIFSNKEK